MQPRLPKYDSQSETTNDTCLWLRTILGRNIEIPKSKKNKHRLPTPTHALTILNNDKTKEIKVRTWQDNDLFQLLFLSSIFPVGQKFTYTQLLFGSIAFKLFNLGQMFQIAFHKLKPFCRNFGSMLGDIWKTHIASIYPHNYPSSWYHLFCGVHQSLRQ